MDQPQSDGVAAVCGSGRICSESEGQRCSRRTDGERGISTLDQSFDEQDEAQQTRLGKEL